jgi:UTP--glucose-1-phosphate uridylyltransferase
MIRNAKTLDPRDLASPPVYQLETAMGSAIAVFEGAQAVRVPRSRFAPVKTTNDLLAIRSDAYTLTGDYRVIANPARTLDHIVVDLDSRYYKMIADLEARFPHGALSLLECVRLTVEGDIRFGANVRAKGDVTLTNHSGAQVKIEDNTLLRGEQSW